MITPSHSLVPSPGFKPVHWCQIRLDDFASIYLKDIDLDRQQLTYKVVSREGQILEATQTGRYRQVADLIILPTCELAAHDFNRAVHILCSTSDYATL